MERARGGGGVSPRMVALYVVVLVSGVTGVLVAQGTR